MPIRCFPDFTTAETRHPFCSVYTSALYAIYLGFFKITAMNFLKPLFIQIRGSGIDALHCAKFNGHPLVMKCFELHHPLKNTKIKFCWMPGRAGILGIEGANIAANTSTTIRETFTPTP
ncbi:hypothetical protein AVEN_96520-1 [Araneus ventricosus]|uniref:Uncharacterized protein n=1 Tax=Araneus ventricosus TaxID=182803 RepID=A0A4Y2CUY9_ARAVE|nr:hypothetical protein AVEN_96520-1 [Araneus ventricosus]